MNTEDGEKLIFWWAAWYHRTPCELRYLSRNPGPDLRLKNSSYSWLELPVGRILFLSSQLENPVFVFSFFAVFFPQATRTWKNMLTLVCWRTVCRCFQRKPLFMDSYIYKTLFTYLCFQAGISIFALGKNNFSKKTKQTCITVLLTLTSC